MTAPRFVRGSKSRVFVYIGGILFVGLCVFVFHGTQVQLDEFKKASDKCQQQQESYAAQLQVVFEYKLRLEKSLQQEKADHRHTKEQLQTRLEEEKQLREKENLDNLNKYSSLQQQYKLLQSQHEDLNDDCSKVRVTHLQNLDEISKLEGQVRAVKSEFKQMQNAKDKELESLKSNYMKIEAENNHLVKRNEDLMVERERTKPETIHIGKENMQLHREQEKLRNALQECQAKCDPDLKKQQDAVLPKPKDLQDGKAPADAAAGASSSAVPVPGQEPNQNQLPMNVLPEPDGNNNAGDKISSSRSTTPQINPDAVQSQEKNPPLLNNVAPVPLPQDVGGGDAAIVNKDKKDVGAQEEVGEGVGPAPDYNRDNREELPAHVPQQPPFHAQDPGNWQIPYGVVPAPQGYEQNVPPAAANEVEIGGGKVKIGGKANWGALWHKPQPLERPDDEEGNNIQVPPNNYPPHPGNHRLYRRKEEHPLHRQFVNAMDKNDPIDVEEAHRRGNNLDQYNNEYDKDGHKGDIQLEEGEEEEDDDMDQLDYEAGNPMKKAKPPVRMPVIQQNRKESVMVNPH